MIIYKHAKFPSDVDPMVPNLVTREDTEESQATCAFEIRLRMQSIPDSINIIQAWDDEELVGFVVGIIYPNKTSMSLPQTWSKTGNPFEIAEYMFSGLLMWAVTCGRNAIVGECDREAGPLFRRYGFVEIAKIIERKITDEEIHTIKRLGKELIHG